MVDGASGDAARMRTFEEAKSTLYGTISPAGAALESASRRRESTVTSVAAYLDRIQLDVSGLSVIHVTGTKGKGSTCAMVESVLRQHGFRTGLYTSPHLLEVTERVRCDGKPITKEAFARYFFQVWDRLQTTSSSPPAAAPATAAAGMPAYFHLLTLVGLWCFVREGVDVCVLEVGMGGRFDATNVVPSPVACGVTMLDLDHTQVLGDTLDKIAWEKGGIFKEGCRAMTVEQPRGGMSVLRECAKTAGCGELEVVKPLPTRDPSGRTYEIGLAGDHQRVNAGLALRLCAVWMEARQQQEHRMPPLGGGTGDTEAFRGSAEVHRGLAECVWPGRCQVFRSPAFPSVTVYLDGAHTEQSIHACLEWFVEKTARAEKDEIGASPTSTDPARVAEATAPTRAGSPPPRDSKQCQRRGRRRRVLWFNASHERDIVPLLDTLASARRRASSRRREDSNSNIATNDDEDDDDDDDDKDDAPLFDEAWFMEVNPGRPSRFAHPTAQELLAPHFPPPASVASVVSSGGSGGVSKVVDDVLKESAAVSSRSEFAGATPAGQTEAAAAPESGKDEKTATEEAEAGAWQRTLQQVWISLQARRGGGLSSTLSGTALEFLEKLSLISTPGENTVLTASAVRGPDEGAAREAGESGVRSGDGMTVEVLCTGSLYAVAAALEAFGAEVR